MKYELINHLLNAFDHRSVHNELYVLHKDLVGAEAIVRPARTYTNEVKATYMEVPLKEVEIQDPF